MSDSTQVKLKAFRPLLEAIQPLEPDEAEEMRLLTRSLLSQPTDSVMTVSELCHVWARR
jgi:hypothetical protein